MFDNYNPCLFFTRQRILTNFSPINLSKNIIQNNFYEDRRIVKTSVVFSQNKYIYFWKIFVPTILLITVENWFKDFFGRTSIFIQSTGSRSLLKKEIHLERIDRLKTTKRVHSIACIPKNEFFPCAYKEKGIPRKLWDDPKAFNERMILCPARI